MTTISENNQAIELTTREIDVIRLVAAGLSSKEIAAQLQIALSTVCVHRRNIIRKSHTSNTIEAAIKFSKGLLI